MKLGLFSKILKFNTDARDPQSGSLAFFPLFSKYNLLGRAQEGVWGGNAHALAFWVGGEIDRIR
jgi:hypothetical protein